ncbi:LacI family DNA-binding transcriptional regulator [Paenibacillus sp. LHD-117]|uniref:LacI family DNA-binding transcriptional regulator n=1 Tax=Paenibacillus sp. LHD-117 TaxID=3071412 RepID=UPI0027DF30B7|nr:LacI family DNA-binding transcriptional regulator [Paenibacillus sp. LHD-117]MDQ6417947.1 LacI family DNA-binding transcriptional regulator [Paenibacillus sp. LHD-117]
MPQKVSIQTIADQLGLSKYAVSRALSGKSGVSEATRERVLELAKTLGYGLPKQKTAAPVSSAASSFVLICINPSIRGDSAYWQRVLEGLIVSSGEKGWHHVIVSQPLSFPSRSNLTPQQAIAPHLNWDSCLGLIVMGTPPYSSLQLMARTGKPLVLLDHSEPLLDCDEVNHANIDAGIKIAHHLLVSRQCRNIVFLSDIAFSTSFAERRIGARLAVERYGGSDAKLREWELTYGDGNWIDTAASRFLRLAPEDRPDGWIGANDDIALKWMQRLQQLGVSIPNDAYVAGIDNVEEAALSSPRLTTVNLSKEELGNRAIEMLERRIARPGTSIEKIQLNAALIPRDSA